MSEIHELTDKEVKAIGDAASTVRRFAKYIKQVNATNYHLRKNLDEAIKAGDVTNEQKVDLRCHETAEKECDRLMAMMREKCKAKGCKCTDEDKEKCDMYDEFVVADWMRGVANGSHFDWDIVFKYACIGRKISRGYTVDEALRNETTGGKTCIAYYRHR